MKFVPYFDLVVTPNIIVDSVPTLATLLTLSHWPGSGTPEALQDDLSAQIVLRYLASDGWLRGVQAVSNNHFDTDGLMGIFALLAPALAHRHRALVVDVASAGDFGVYRFAEAARLAFAVSSYASSERSPLAATWSGRSSHERVALLYEELLPRVEEWLRDLSPARGLWADEERYLRDSESALRRGDIRIDERPDLDLAIVTLPDGGAIAAPPELPEYADALCHPMAIHSATPMSRLWYRCGRRYEVHYRYETWVHYVSRAHLPRVDLEPLALELSAREGSGAQWVFDGVSHITPRLRLLRPGESRIAPEAFEARLLEVLGESARGSGSRAGAARTSRAPA